MICHRNRRKIRGDAARLEAESLELCRRHLDALLRYATALTARTSAIEDAVEHAFVSYFAARMRGREVGAARIWLARAVRNQIRSLVGAGEDPGGLPPDAQPERGSTDTRHRLFRRTLASLPRCQRECVRLRIEGYACAEIASILRIRKGKVGALIFRGFRHFHESGVLAPMPPTWRGGFRDTFLLIAHLRYLWEESRYRRRVQKRVYAYLLLLGLATAAAAVAAVLMQ
jgi:DNA-directed RNA polymerase specialized sigma24 family protein